MGFNRISALGEMPDAQTLTRDMVGIGMNFAGEANVHAPIEETLAHASYSGMTEQDFRVLSLLTTWIGVHSAHLNVARLLRCVEDSESPEVLAYWSAVAHWQSRDRRFRKLAKVYQGAPVDLLTVGTEFQIARRGEDPRFSGSCLRVPDKTLRDRRSDIVLPAQLARKHAGYRNRVLMGPTWRADVWTVLETTPDLSVAQVARRAGCSFATAWGVLQDFRILQHTQPI